MVQGFYQMTCDFFQNACVFRSKCMDKAWHYPKVVTEL